MKHDPVPSRSRRAAVSLALLLACAGVSAAAAQGVPSDAVLRDFQPIGDYTLWFDGKDVPTAQIYQSEAPAMLIMSSALPAPVLLMPREGTVSTVPIMKIAKQPDGSVDLLADAVLAPQGRFQAVDDVVGFTVAGKPAKLKTRPPLLGLKNAAALKAYSPTYTRGAQSYRPNGQTIANLKKTARPVKVQVFFGSWCSFCKHYAAVRAQGGGGAQGVEGAVRVRRAAARPEGAGGAAAQGQRGADGDRLRQRQGGGTDQWRRLEGAGGGAGEDHLGGVGGARMSSGWTPPLCQRASGCWSKPT